MSEQPIRWKFKGDDGSFVLRRPDQTSYLYFPLANEAGMMSAVSPELQGDAKIGQNAFLLTPTSVEDLHHTSFGRNFWIMLDDGEVWSATGRSARQRVDRTTSRADDVTLEAGLLWHKVTRSSATLGLRAEVTNFVPAHGEHVELMKVTITNTADRTRTITPTAAIPIYGRSADNLRDHRHVTSLLNRIYVEENGITIRPTLSFDERGHRRNELSYGVRGVQGEAEAPIGFFPRLADFVGDGGSLDWPAAVTSGLSHTARAGDRVDGGEAIGALRFADVLLDPGATVQFRIVLGVSTSHDCAADPRYLDRATFAAALHTTRQYWSNKVNRLCVVTADPDFDVWLRWVAIQPTLRRIFGCSFLPYHDYGRGGRGWRDLWQDCLALLLMEPDGVRELLVGAFAGLRMDGSNATIIGSRPGEFIADRNSIPRVWMDHAAWPWLTTKLYLDQTGDLSFLFEKQTYFRDQHTMRCQTKREDWQPGDRPIHPTDAGDDYEATVLEHLLVQNLTAFFNVGDHNHLLLEDGDWNDGLDMASGGGASVALSALYARNLLQLADTLEIVAEQQGHANVEIAEECGILLDSLNDRVDYTSPGEKRELLTRYLTRVAAPLSGRYSSIQVGRLISDLRLKGEWLRDHIRATEWMRDRAGRGWFNGYYDDDGGRLEGYSQDGVRMTLTGQVFAILSGAADETQLDAIIESVRAHLWDDRLGGCRLNTDFKDVLTNMGRCFGFAYGEKENGAVFCHMAVMYAYALYTRDRWEEGSRVLSALYRQAVDFPTSRVYPGLPEYFNARGRGMYPYLTGSASWYLLTTLTQAFGVRGHLGDLVLDPRLDSNRFNAHGIACVNTVFAGKCIQVIYQNGSRASADCSTVTSVTLAGEPIEWSRFGRGALITRKVLDTLPVNTVYELRVDLA